MIQYGLERLVLLGSAGYQRAELPLDDSVSLVAPNNQGKTSLINALQFLLIIDQNRMDFGAHDIESTRRFYFPNNSAYILLQACLPKVGTVVLGCVGKGVSGQAYEYFAYTGPLVLDEYRLPDDTLVQQPRLRDHLAQQGRILFSYEPTEFRDALYGSRKRRNLGEPDITIFHLEHQSDASAYRKVLTRTLRLDKLSSRNVKEYLLDIFKRDLPDASIDFKQEWESAFSEVNAERAQYQAALTQSHRIEVLSQEISARMTLRGKIIAWRPKIEQDLQQWQAYYQQQKQALIIEINCLRDEQSKQIEQDRALVATKIALEQSLCALLEDDKKQAHWMREFALIPDRAQLESHLLATEKKLDQQITLIGQTQQRAPAAIHRELVHKQQELAHLQQQKSHLTNTLYHHLSHTLAPEHLDSLNRLFNRSVMTLNPNDFQLDSAQLQSMLAKSAASEFTLAGLQLNLNTLTPQYHPLSEVELNEQWQDTFLQIENLQRQQQAAEHMANTLADKRALEQEKQLHLLALQNFDHLQQLLATHEQRKEQQRIDENQLTETQSQLDQLIERGKQLTDKLNSLTQQQLLLEEQHNHIDKARNRRTDQSDEFVYLTDLPHHSGLAEPKWDISELSDRLQTYNADCNKLRDMNRDLELALSELHRGGLTKYQYTGSHDAEWVKIFDFHRMLPKEAEALEKRARSAVVNVTASLKQLKNGLDAFIGRMREFNRLIGARHLSDLKTFKIEPRKEPYLIDAIDVMLSTAEQQVSHGDSFDLFNQHSVLDEPQLDRAKQVLIQEGEARQGLKVADLFSLQFVVGKHDQPEESFEEIDSAASNGTVLMAKLVTGLAMLHLMQHKNQKIRTVCYLDEALALDNKNQKSLIEAAHDFGFALIFASPAPLSTVRYCVPIQQHQGYNIISTQNWQTLKNNQVSV